MTVHALLFTLAAIGISETVYLIRQRMAHRRAACLLGESCNAVLESKYNKIFGVHNDVLGLFFYLGLSFITALLVIGAGPLIWLDILIKLSIVGAAIMSLIFIYLQWRVIRAWCFWCLMSAATVGLMLVIILTSELIIV